MAMAVAAGTTTTTTTTITSVSWSLPSCGRFSSSSSVSLHCSPSSLCSPRRRLTSCSAQVQGEFRCNQSTFISNGEFACRLFEVVAICKMLMICAPEGSWIGQMHRVRIVHGCLCFWASAVEPVCWVTPCNVIFSTWQIKLATILESGAKAQSNVAKDWSFLK